MKPFILFFIFSIFISSAFAKEEFSEARLINKRTKDAIAAKCIVQNEDQHCLAFMFYKLYKNDPAKAQLLTLNPISLESIEKLKTEGPVTIFKDEIKSMIDATSEPNSDQSLFGEIVEDVSGGIALVMTAPVGIPFMVVSTPIILMHKAAHDHKYNKFLNTFKKKKVRKMNIEPFNKLVRILEKIN